MSATPIQPVGIEAQVCQDIAQRQARGIAKYGTTVADNPLPLRAWLQHQYEELLDAAIYARRAIEELDGRPVPAPWYPDASGTWVEVPDDVIGRPISLAEDSMVEVLTNLARNLRDYRLRFHAAHGWTWKCRPEELGRIVAYKVVRQ